VNKQCGSSHRPLTDREVTSLSHDPFTTPTNTTHLKSGAEYEGIIWNSLSYSCHPNDNAGNFNYQSQINYATEFPALATSDPQLYDKQSLHVTSSCTLSVDHNFSPTQLIEPISPSSPRTKACLWPACNTLHQTDSYLLIHWTSHHLRPIHDLSRLQTSKQKEAFCLWNRCYRRFKRSSDLDRHVRSVHLELHFNCSFTGCDNNGGRGFSRPDKLRHHNKSLHEFN
jgi:hypothetical protein